MPLAEAKLQAELLGLFNAMKESPMSEADYAAKLAAAITDHIKTATVTVDPGIAVTTPVGPGATSAPGTGMLS